MTNLHSLLLLFGSMFAFCGVLPNNTQGQVPRGNGQLPHSDYDLYVDLSASATTGLPLHWVQTRRVSRGQQQQLDLLNLIVKSEVVREQFDRVSSSERFIHFRGDELLVAMAILPDEKTGRVTWEPVSRDTISAKHRLTLAQLLDDCYARVFEYKAKREYEFNKLTRRNDIVPIIEHEGKVWTTRNAVLTEYFLLRNHPTYWPTAGDNITINTQSRPFTRADFKQAEQASLKSTSVEWPASPVSYELGQALLLEQKTNDVYTFWSQEPTIADGPLRDYGSVDIRFKPGVGIISGKYNNHFAISQESEANTFFEVVQIQKLNK